jgi:hypothetical protein
LGFSEENVACYAELRRGGSLAWQVGYFNESQMGTRYSLTKQDKYVYNKLKSILFKFCGSFSKKGKKDKNIEER